MWDTQSTSAVTNTKLIDGMWEELSDDKAIHKACQVMRDIARPDRKYREERKEERLKNKRRKVGGGGIGAVVSGSETDVAASNGPEKERDETATSDNKGANVLVKYEQEGQTTNTSGSTEGLMGSNSDPLELSERKQEVSDKDTEMKDAEEKALAVEVVDNALLDGTATTNAKSLVKEDQRITTIAL